MANKVSASKIEKAASDLTKELLEKLGVEAKVGVEPDPSVVKVKITGEELGLLIGYRGENLESLQLLLGIAINNKLDLDSRVPVLVDVGDWRAQREESLRSLVAKEIKNISGDKTSVELSPMPPAQRRITHLLVEDYKELTSESIGEEPNRRVIIKKGK